MATAVQKITLSASRDIPFNKLVLSQGNVRRVKAGVSIEELAEDIVRRTLLQGLSVRPILDAEGQETGMRPSRLDLLTPTDHEHAHRWRADCRANAAARRARRAKPSPRDGQTIIFDEPLAFADGRSFDRLEVIANPGSHRTVLFRAPGSGNLYRIPNIKSRAYRLIDRAPG